MNQLVFVQIDDQYINVHQITSVAYANGTTLWLADGRKITAPDLSVEEMLDRINNAIEVANQ